MGYRRKARECAMQMLFQVDMTGDRERAVRESFWSTRKAPAPTRDYADRLVTGVTEHLEKIDELLAGKAHNWRVDRMSTVDRSLLRMAIYELLHEPDTPRKVIINEAIEIAKKFSSDESGHFVNGVLDAVRQELEPVAG